ncbi:hypothetical protein DPMN_062512 [Dreissena polymorpha]|uniref:Uncharacterized protein n=1 Tax=Dreissena polymorpha TaxID=45954 RepID=A0A9D4C9L3_DREPO|nr:hypothetical protein DPMN_062512 [Dreissena polymorpha]
MPRDWKRMAGFPYPLFDEFICALRHALLKMHHRYVKLFRGVSIFVYALSVTWVDSYANGLVDVYL